MAIIEGGVRFPMNEFTRAFLNAYELSPDQLTCNSYRIINSAYELKLKDNLDLRIWDLLDIYAVSRNKSFGRYFLMTRPKRRQIVEHIPDSEKWAEQHLVVSGNFAVPSDEDLFPIPTRKGNLGWYSLLTLFTVSFHIFLSNNCLECFSRSSISRFPKIKEVTRKDCTEALYQVQGEVGARHTWVHTDLQELVKEKAQEEQAEEVKERPGAYHF